MRFLSIFPGSGKEGRTIGVEQRDDRKLLVVHCFVHKEQST